MQTATATDCMRKSVVGVFRTYKLPETDWGWYRVNDELIWATPSGYGTLSDCSGKLITLTLGMFVKGRKGDGKRLLEFARGEAKARSENLAEYLSLDKSQVVGRKRVIETVRTTRKKCEVSVEWDGPVDTGSVRFVLPPPFVTYRGKSGFVYRALVQEK